MSCGPVCSYYSKYNVGVGLNLVRNKYNLTNSIVSLSLGNGFESEACQAHGLYIGD